MKRIYVARGAVDASLVRSRLRAAGIEAIVRGQLIPVSAEALPSVWVPAADEERARVIIQTPAAAVPTTS